MHASTAIVDIWLGLLQHALHAVHLLVQEPDTTPLGREIANNRNALLELLNQLIVHWKVHMPALQELHASLQYGSILTKLLSSSAGDLS